ncbi:MAG TPA: hypothetical protein VFT29_13040 [Gemmatimonadaceae bacterium]|nr:hypothetical protein [Gemmatimonadaceae bacterium]
MTRLPFRLALLAIAFGSFGASTQIAAQESARSDRYGTWTFDLGGQLAQPIGEFRSQIDRAWGVGGSVRYHMRELRLLGLRGDASWLNYGNETKNVPLSPTVNRVFVDMRTTNNIALATIGPELLISSGPVRPYAYAFAGYSYFYTESSAGDDNGGEAFASTTNFDDGGWATGWGGGVRIPVVVRSVEAAFDVGARLTRNGTRSYLRSGDIIDLPDRTLAINPRRTSADFWQYHLGVSFSPRRRDRGR